MALEKTPMFVTDTVNGRPVVVCSRNGYYLICASAPTAEHAADKFNRAYPAPIYGWHAPNTTPREPFRFPNGKTVAEMIEDQHPELIMEVCS